MKQTILGTFALAATAVACSASPHDTGLGPTESTSRATESITDGHNDVYPNQLDQFKADIAVYLQDGCTGSLIAPRVVLTARHCVRGDDKKGATHATTMRIGVGATLNQAATHMTGPGNVIPIFDAPVRISDDTATDVAIIVLPIEDGNFVQRGLFINRPSFVPVDYYGKYWGAGYAIADGGNTRQFGEFDMAVDEADFGVPESHDGALLSNGPSVTHEGDSGGPLFRFNADGSRDVVGVSSCYITGIGGQASCFADITTDQIRNFIVSTSQDHSRSPAWLARHGKSDGNYWYGEADYTGQCSPGDADCDYWYDAHDDCPGTFNPGQIETIRDGAGDACVPTVSSVSPASGPNVGGNQVTVTGTNFDTAGHTQVLFGGAPSPAVTCPSTTLCTATVPRLLDVINTTPLAVDVRVLVAGNTSPIGPQDKYTYVAAPQCSTILECYDGISGYPHAAASCASTVHFYDEAHTSTPLATGLAYTFATDNDGVGAYACDVNTGSCSPINTTAPSPNYCHANGSQVPQLCHGTTHPPTTCSSWNCCENRWHCGQCI